MTFDEMLELSKKVAEMKTWAVYFRGKSQAGNVLDSHVTVDGMTKEEALAHAKKLLARMGWTLLQEPTIEVHPMTKG